MRAGPSIVIGYNTSHYAWLLRSGLIRALIHEGFAVTVLSPRDAYTGRLIELGASHSDTPMNMGANPICDLVLLYRFWRFLRRERPAVFLGYTVKPNVYGSLAAHACGIPVINNIAGLGAVFINQSWLTCVVKGLYRIALSRSERVLFQNEDDRRMFVDGGLVRASVTGRLPGSGVDLGRFSPVPAEDDGCNGMHFLLIARMLWDKGVGEYVEAARLVRRRHPEVEFSLLGFLDVQNPAAISRAQMDDWVREGVVRYLGASDDVRPYIADADCVVLPSFREGTPRSLLEAAAMGRPIITTDAVGCREVVDDGMNGFQCRPGDAADLAAKMDLMIALSPAARAEMGRRGREKMEREFDERIVIAKYLEIIRGILDRR